MVLYNCRYAKGDIITVRQKGTLLMSGNWAIALKRALSLTRKRGCLIMVVRQKGHYHYQKIFQLSGKMSHFN